MLFDQLTTLDLGRADTAVVRTLRSRIGHVGETRRPVVLHQGVFLLETEPELLVAVLLVRLDGLDTSVGRVRRHVLGDEDVTQDQEVVAAAQRRCDRFDHLGRSLEIREALGEVDRLALHVLDLVVKAAEDFIAYQHTALDGPSPFPVAIDSRSRNPCRSGWSLIPPR